MSNDEFRRGPLSRFRVLDLTRVRSGPNAVRQLADWGADVIKIESPSEADNVGVDGARHRSDFQNLHRNKRSLTLDLKAPKGREVFLDLASRADVVVENFRPDVKRRLGIDYEAVKAVNKRIVYASISGFGQSGPYASWPGFDQVAQAMGGLMSTTGTAESGPLRAGIAIADLASGLYCALGILTALLEREVSGEGQAVETSLLEAQIALMDFQAVRYLVEGEIAGRTGNNHPTASPMGLYVTADDPVVIASAGNEIFHRLCDAIGAEALKQDPLFSSPQARATNREQLNAEIEALTQQHPSAYWVALFNKAGVPCGKVNTIDEVFADPQVTYLEMYRTVEHPGLGAIRVLRPAVTLSRTLSAVRSPSPERGEQSDEILLESGYDRGRIDALRAAKVI